MQKIYYLKVRKRSSLERSKENKNVQEYIVYIVCRYTMGFAIIDLCWWFLDGLRTIGHFFHQAFQDIRPFCTLDLSGHSTFQDLRSFRTFDLLVHQTFQNIRPGFWYTRRLTFFTFDLSEHSTILLIRPFCTFDLFVYWTFHISTIFY